MTVNHLMKVRILPGQQGVPNLKCWVIETYYQMSPSKLELGALSNGCLADCKSVVIRHWGFESLHSHNMSVEAQVDVQPVRKAGLGYGFESHLCSKYIGNFL